MSPMVVEGVDKLVGKLQKLDRMTPEIMGQSLLAGAFVIEALIKMSMNTAKHGRTYRRSGKSHTASAPGEAPAIDYGALINSIHTRLVQASESGAEAQVFTNAEYGEPLEFGTSKMAARPFMRPAADQHDKILPAIEATAKRLVDEAARG